MTIVAINEDEHLDGMISVNELENFILMAPANQSIIYYVGIDPWKHKKDHATFNLAWLSYKAGLLTLFQKVKHRPGTKIKQQVERDGKLVELIFERPFHFIAVRTDKETSRIKVDGLALDALKPRKYEDTRTRSLSRV